MRFSRAMRPNQAMQLTAGRSEFPLNVTSTSIQQRRSLSPAVADLVPMRPLFLGVTLILAFSLD
jgi:hypothetical protein